MPTVDIVLSPALWPLVDAKYKNIVVIDIFRATSTIAAALKHGAASVVPVLKAEETLTYKSKGYLTAGERNGLPIDGFDFGNSPVLIQDEKLKGKKLALTTTNGTKCFDLAKSASSNRIYSGAFANIQATADILIQEKKDVILFCAGWKDLVNLEDTLYAGTLYHLLQNHFKPANDAVLIAEDVFIRAQEQGFNAVLNQSSHFQRLEKFGAQRDMDFSLQQNILNSCVVLKDNELVLYKDAAH